MQSSERMRLVNAYRNEAAGRLGLLIKCVACIAVLALLGAIAVSGTDNRAQNATPASDTGTQPSYAVVHP